MNGISRAFRFACGAALSALVAACSDGTVIFGGKTDRETPDTITVEGDVRDINPQIAGADIVVFVFTELADPPGDFTVYEKQRSVAISSDDEDLEFTVTQVESGTLTVVFLQDHASDPDGTIDVDEDPEASDPIAILEDPENVLRDVRAGETIRIEEIDIDFNAGTADARTIRSVRDTTEEEE
jgi:hypothetical protein